jgi:hypothetical protein
MKKQGPSVIHPRSGQPRTAATDDNLKTVTEVLVGSLIKLMRTTMTESGTARISSQ